MKNYLFSYLIKKLDFFLQNYKRVAGISWLVESGLWFLLLTILITPYWQSKVSAQENADSSSTKSLKVTFNPPEGNKPKTSKGGASRSIRQCINQAENVTLPLTLLVPTLAPGLTVASHPTVLAYLPETNADKVFVSWQDENNNYHHQTILPIENNSRIITLTLPDNAPPLEIGKNYQWSLAIMCQGQLQPDSPMVQGQIKRIILPSHVTTRLKNANALETAAIYAQAGIWYETVAILAQLHTTQPLNPHLRAHWQELLTSVGLQKFASIPLTP